MRIKYYNKRQTLRSLAISMLFTCLGFAAPLSNLATILYAGFLAVCVFGVIVLYLGKVQNNAKPYKHRAIEFAIILAYAALAGWLLVLIQNVLTVHRHGVCHGRKPYRAARHAR